MERFDPKTDKFPYPEYTDNHYIFAKKDLGLVFDENYPYIDKSKKFLRKQTFTRFLLNVLVFPFAKIRLGLRIKGKENLKKYKDVIDKGIISCCNHVHMWDYISIMRAVRPNKPYVLAVDNLVNGETGHYLRSVGAIPIPLNNFRATKAYVDQVDKHLQEGGWLHIYPEGSTWEYYGQIRPFKRGVAYFACRNNKPIIPFGISYRKPNWFRKNILKQIACLTLSIGEPLYPDLTITNLKERELDLTRRCHEAVCRLANIDPKENLYPPIFDNTKRIDYYTDKYGVGYKGSW